MEQNIPYSLNKTENSSEGIIFTDIDNVLKKLLEKYNIEDINTRWEIIKKTNNTDNNEIILNEKKNKFTTFPIEYKSIWDAYKTQQSSYWRAEEIDFSRDHDDFMTLNENEQFLIKRILSFFAASDGIVNFNLSNYFIKQLQITEGKYAYTFQQMMENIHGEVYSLMLDNIIKDPIEKEFMFNAIKNVRSIQMMADWTFKWIKSNKSFSHRVIAMLIVEGIFFSGAFATIFWLKKYKSGSDKPFMNGLMMSNKLISRDENLHAEFACDIYNLLENKLVQNEINEIFKEGVGIAQNFMIDSLQVKLIGMNHLDMNNYIEYIADGWLVRLKYKKIYNTKNPFDFMDTISMTGKTNFHENRVTEYQTAFKFNADFKNTLNKDSFNDSDEDF
jgi:ribonucleotide reductase beta subunit family protein with ferritin-like domain